MVNICSRSASETELQRHEQRSPTALRLSQRHGLPPHAGNARTGQAASPEVTGSAGAGLPGRPKEEPGLPGGVASARCRAAQRPQSDPPAVGLSWRIRAEIIVVLDACHDAAGVIAVRFPGVRTMAINARSVGAARRVGARAALAGALTAELWLASMP
jgi:hypothetical protein